MKGLLPGLDIFVRQLVIMASTLTSLFRQIMHSVKFTLTRS